jgi:hypothetical protein
MFQPKRLFQKLPKKIDYLVSVIIFLSFSFIYLKTTCPTVFWWDSGEFIANIATLGIAHRPSFPIYILIARVFTLFPLGNFILRVNLFSALCAALSISFSYLIFIKLLNLYLLDYSKDSAIRIFCGIGSLLLFGFTYSFWIQAVRAEVYALCLLFVTLVVFLLLRYIETGNNKYLYLSMFLFGLGLGNHHIILLSVMPALVIITMLSRHKMKFNHLVYACMLTLLGLSIYLYLPIRNISHPALNWGNPGNTNTVLSSVLALESLKKMGINSLIGAIDNFPILVRLIYNQLTPFVFLPSCLGLILLLRRNLKLFFFILTIFIGNSLATLLVVSDFFVYNMDLHGYLLPSFFAFVLSLGMGVTILFVETEKTLANRISGFKLLRTAKTILLFLMMSASLLLFRENLPKTDLSNDRLAERYVVDAVKNIEKGSVIFVDNVNFDFIYRGLRYGAKFREDLIIIDRSFLPADWYFAQQSRLFPELYRNVPQNSRGEKLFYEMLKFCLANNIPALMEFTERDRNLTQYLIPKGAFFEVIKSSNAVISPEVIKIQENWERVTFFGLSADKVKDDIDAQRNLVLWLYRQGLFYKERKMINLAKGKFNRGLEFDAESEELWRELKGLQ